MRFKDRASIKPLMGTKQLAPCDAAVIIPVYGETTGLAISNGLNPRMSSMTLPYGYMRRRRSDPERRLCRRRPRYDNSVGQFLLAGPYSAIRIREAN